MLVVNIVVTLFFVLLGILFMCGKGLDLVAGYNTLSKEEKEKFDPRALSRCMAKMMFALAGGWCVLSVGAQLGKRWLFWVGFALFLLIVLFFVIYMNAGNRLKKQ